MTLLRKTHSEIFYVSLLTPVIALMVLVIFFPVLDTIRLSFFNASFVKPGLQAPFIGLENYREALGKPLFWHSLWVTVKWTVGSIVFQFGLGFALALLINQRVRARNTVRSFFIIPWMIPGAIAALMWKWMYHGSIGLVNVMLIKAGIVGDSVPWLADRRTVLAACAIVNVWRGSPFFMVMLYGGLQTIPRTLYEAAAIDGAGGMYRLLHITIPMLMPLIATLVIFGFIQAFNFIDIVLVLTRGGPANHTLTLPIYSWRSAFTDLRISYGATISVLMCLSLVVFVVLATIWRKRRER